LKPVIARLDPFSMAEASLAGSDFAGESYNGDFSPQ
jgi:hypothetical protein